MESMKVRRGLAKRPYAEPGRSPPHSEATRRGRPPCCSLGTSSGYGPAPASPDRRLQPCRVPSCRQISAPAAAPQVVPCSKHYVHDWTECPFAHPHEKARRRDPRKHQYTGIACPSMRQARRLAAGGGLVSAARCNPRHCFRCC